MAPGWMATFHRALQQCFGTIRSGGGNQGGCHTRYGYEDFYPRAKEEKRADLLGAQGTTHPPGSAAARDGADGCAAIATWKLAILRRNSQLCIVCLMCMLKL